MPKSTPKKKKSAKPKANTAPSPKSLAAEELAKKIKDLPEIASAGVPVLPLLKERELKSPLLLIGEEAIRSKRLVDWFRKNLSGKGLPGFEYWFASELTSKSAIDNLLNTHRTPSLFCQERFLVIYDAHLVRASVADSLTQEFKKPSSHTFVILVGEKINQQTPLLNRLKKDGQVVKIEPLKGNKLKRWIQKEAKDLGNDIAPQAIDLLADAFDGELATLSLELSKLSLLVEKDKPISVSAVKAFLSHNPEKTSFELIQQISKKNLAASENCVQQLLRQGFHPLQISSFLSRAFQTVLKEKISEPNQQNPSWFVRQLRPAIQAFPEKQALKTCQAIRDLDLDLKSSKLPPETSLSLKVQQLASRR